MNSTFPDFQEKHGIDNNRRGIPSKVIDFYRERIPNEIIQEWEAVGWGSYGNGLIWLVDPQKFEDLLEDWGVRDTDSCVLVRTSFGDLFLWKDSSFWRVSVKYGRLMELTEVSEILFEIIFCDDIYLNDALNIKLHNEATKKLGILEEEDCYAFEPAIALGGGGDLESIKVVKLREHLHFLSQLI